MRASRVRISLVLATGVLAVAFRVGSAGAAPGGAAFLMPVDYAFDSGCTGDVLVVGTIESGSVGVGDEVELVGIIEGKLKPTITGVEMFRKEGAVAGAGDAVGLLLRGVDKKDIWRGIIVAKPGSVTAHREFRAIVRALKDEGGRHTPFHDKMTLQFGFRTTEVTGDIELPAGRGTLTGNAPGTATIRLIVPVVMDKGLEFTIREGGRTVGAGQVIEIIK